MSLSDDQMQTIIERAQRSMRAEPGVLAATPGEEWDALVLVPGFVPAPEKALSAVFAQFGKQMQIVFLSEAVFSAEGIPACRLDWATQKNELVELMVRAQRVVLQGSIPSPANPPSGCKFHTRCPYATERCKTEAPKQREVEPGHYVVCHLYEK